MIQRVATVERAFELRAPSTLLLRFADGASLEVTAVHPLYAVGRGFTAAGELRIGDRVAEAADGEAATLSSVVRLGTPKPVYNLTVGGTHTYFVRAGEDDLWAHNADCGEPGVYEGEKNGKEYVGQSKNMDRRTSTNGHLDKGAPVTKNPMPGSTKREREVAEQIIINEKGGIGGGRLSNKINPVAEKHWPGYDIPGPESL